MQMSRGDGYDLRREQQRRKREDATLHPDAGECTAIRISQWLRHLTDRPIRGSNETATNRGHFRNLRAIIHDDPTATDNPAAQCAKPSPQSPTTSVHTLTESA